MTRIAIFVYGIVCYALFFGCFLYSIAFLGDFDIVSKTIDAGSARPVGVALVINLGLLSLFAVQHSVMARPGFKRLWTKVIPEAAERSTYVLVSTACLGLLYFFWQPIGGTVWDVRDPTGRAALSGVYLFGWALFLYATALIDHFDLFGVRQVWLHMRGKPYTHHPFGTPGLYRHIRHPLYLGWFVIFWATPTMSAGHLLLAAVTTAYIMIAAMFEERDLVAHFGGAYQRYKETTPRYFPRLSIDRVRRSSKQAVSALE